jgi:hypothetical protein
MIVLHNFQEFTMPNTEYLAEIKMDLEIGGSNAEDVIGMYEASIMDGINQTAWNLCDCDDQTQSERFGNPTLVEYDIKLSDHNNIQLIVAFRVTANDPNFIETVINDYMDGFDDWIRSTTNGYYSRTGSRIGTDIKVTDWNLEIKKNGK